jgi:hypothetical protein
MIFCYSRCTANAVPHSGGVKRRGEGMLHTARLTLVCLAVPILLFMPIPGSGSDAKSNYV